MTPKFPMRVLFPSFASFLMMFFLMSCGSSSSSDTPGAASSCSSQATVASASYNELWTTVFAPQCGACHGPGTNSGTVGGPDMRTADTFYTGLVGKKGSDYSTWSTFAKNRESCLGLNLIATGAPEQSLVVGVLASTTTLPGDCTVKSHIDVPQSVCITAPNLAKLKEWITAGASR
ncbi:MAG: hypothetical protein H7249_10080 [Chitinophagaceae bacterium]|nr:hypothetical protein [Oligoflexus sp.]